MSSDLVTQLIQTYGYVAMIPGVLLFGPAVSIIAGFMVRLEYLQLLPTVLCLAGTELMSDVVWYSLGKRYGERFVKRFGRFFGFNEESIVTAKRLFARYHDIIIFTSKLTAGLGVAPAIFFAAGLSRVPFKRYMAFNIAGQVIWTSSLLAIGYFLGNLYAAVSNTVDRILAIAFIAIVGVVIVLLRFRAVRMLNENENEK